MRLLLALAGLAALLFLLPAPAAAADYQGRLLDGHWFRAMVYGPLGAVEPSVVHFDRDEARVQMLDGEQLLVILYNRSIDDIHFVTGKSLSGGFYRLDLQESGWFYGRAAINDPFFAPNVPWGGEVIPVIPGAIQRGGGAHRGGG